MSFRTILEAAQGRNHSTLAVGLAPTLDRLPTPMQRFDDPFLPFGKAIIDATSELVCAYVFHLASYLALGAAGAVALERTIAYVPVHVVKILHGPFTTPDYVQAAFEGAFGADAVTISATTNPANITPYVMHAYHGVFIQAPPGYDALPVLKLNEDYPGQVGIYKQAEPHHNVLGVFFEPYPEIHWYWGDAVYASREENFREAVYNAALHLRQKPSL